VYGYGALLSARRRPGPRLLIAVGNSASRMWPPASSSRLRHARVGRRAAAVAGIDRSGLAGSSVPSGDGGSAFSSLEGQAETTVPGLDELVREVSCREALRVGQQVWTMACPEERFEFAAGDDEVLVSSTVKDLVAGSGLAFADRGVHVLKGVPDEWRLYSVE
jgi:hypothetical protein